MVPDSSFASTASVQPGDIRPDERRTSVHLVETAIVVHSTRRQPPSFPWTMQVFLVLLACFAMPAAAQVVPDEDIWTEEPFSLNSPELTREVGPEVERGLQFYRDGHYAKAADALESAVLGRQGPVEIHIVYVHSLLRSDRSDAALLGAESALKAFPGHPGLLMLMGKAQAQRGALEPALDAYEGAYHSVEEGAAWPEGFDAAAFRVELQQLCLVLGSRAIDRGAYEEALEYARRADVGGAPAPQAETIRAYVYLQRGDPERAARTTAEALDRSPENTFLLRIRAQALGELERYDELASVFEQLYRQFPEDVEIGLGYAQALLLDGQNQVAQLLFQKLLESFPKDRRIYDALVEINRRKLNFAGAARIRQQQQIVFPNDASLAWDRAELLEQAKQYAQARAVYDSLAAVNPTDPAPAIAAAETFEYADSLGQAAVAYWSVVADFPDRVEPRRALADVLIEQARESRTDWSDVLTVHQELADRTSGDLRAEALSRVGEAYEALGRPDSARSIYRAALDAENKNTWAHYRIAALEHDNAEALSHAQMALRLVLQQAEDAQSRMLGMLQQTGLPRPGDRDVYVQAAAASDLAADIFTFFGERFPLEQTEPVILDVMETYNASGRLLYLTGRYYEAHDRDADALRFYQRATRKAPDLRDAHLALGAQHEAAGRTRAAILSYERALGADEQHPDAYRALIRLYRTQDRLDVLVRRWQSRLRATPQNDVLREHLVDALHRIGRHNDARAIAARNDG